MRDDTTGRWLIDNLLALAVRVHDAKQILVQHAGERWGREHFQVPRGVDAVAELFDAEEHLVVGGKETLQILRVQRRGQTGGVEHHRPVLEHGAVESIRHALFQRADERERARGDSDAHSAPHREQ